MTKGADTLCFTYDAVGLPLTVTHKTGSSSTTYYYLTNAQGDVVAIIDSTGTAVATYSYDAWGNPIAITGTSSIVNLNPLRYRGYIWDAETELYYLQSRYYSPERGRFISPDSYISTGQGILGYGMFLYCGNNPVVRLDWCGDFWDTIFDFFSFCESVIDVWSNPTDPWAWAGLVCDTIDFIPFLTGCGKGLRLAKATGSALDGASTLSRASEFGIDSYKALRKQIAGTGLEAHHVIEKKVS